MRYLLDTSVLIGATALPDHLESSISSVSVAELHFGLLAAKDEEIRAERAARLGLVEARFGDPVPIDDRVAREWGRLMAAVQQRGGRPRRRSSDLAIAASANVNGAVLITHNTKELKIIEDLVEVRAV